MEEKVICYCLNVTEGTIVAAIKGGARTLKEIRSRTGACTGTQCAERNPMGRCCSDDVLEILKRELPATTSSSCCCGCNCED